MSKVWIVARYYNNKERPNVSERDRYTFYGWTKSRLVADAFSSQRNPEKYRIKKWTMTELAERFGDNTLLPELMIDYVPLKMASTGETVPLFITKGEMVDAEKKIIRMVTDESRLVERDNGKMNLLSMYFNLVPHFKSALEYIGFNPPELYLLFDSVEDDDLYMDNVIDTLIETYPVEKYEKMDGVFGMEAFQYDYQKVIWSVEAFIKVLREDL